MKTTLTLLCTILSLQMLAQNMQIEWQQCYGGSDYDEAWDIIATDNGYLIAGATESNDGDVSYNHGTTDGWLIKTNKLGEMIWEKTYGGSYGEGIFRILPADSNNYYLLCSANSADGDISIDPYPGTTDYWIVKIDSEGNILWETILGGNGPDQIWNGTSTSDHGVVAIGWTGSSDGDITNYYGAYDMWAVKVNVDGEKEWDFTIGTDFFENGNTIIQTSDGGYLIGGPGALGEGGNVDCEPFNANYEVILFKLDSNRNIEWQNCYGGWGNESIANMIELEDGYLLSAIGNSNSGDLEGSGWHGEMDIWAVRIDGEGNIIWQKCFGGEGVEASFNVFLSDNGSFNFVGSTASFYGDVVGNHSINQHQRDIWIINVSADGELISQQCIGGGMFEFTYYGAVRKDDHSFVIAGQTDYGPSYDVQCIPYTLYIRDLWVFELQDSTVSVKEHKKYNLQLDVYPNPADDYVRFDYELNPAIKNPKLKIFNLQGVVLAEIPLKSTSGVEIWNCSSVAPGMYFYQISQEGRSISKGKIIIGY